MKKLLFIVLGLITLIVGSIGIFTPGIPTTPLYLATIYLFSKSSPRLHSIITNHKIVGKYTANYINSGGMSRKSKVTTILLMVTMTSISTIFFIEGTIAKIIPIVLCIIGCIVVTFVVKNVEKE